MYTYNLCQWDIYAIYIVNCLLTYALPVTYLYQLPLCIIYILSEYFYSRKSMLSWLTLEWHQYTRKLVIWICCVYLLMATLFYHDLCHTRNISYIIHAFLIIFSLRQSRRGSLPLTIMFSYDSNINMILMTVLSMVLISMTSTPYS